MLWSSLFTRVIAKRSYSHVVFQFHKYKLGVTNVCLVKIGRLMSKKAIYIRGKLYNALGTDIVTSYSESGSSYRKANWYSRK